MANNATNSKIIPDGALVTDYFSRYSEPHRRHATILEWPCYVLHVARYFKSRDDDAAPKTKTVPAGTVTGTEAADPKPAHEAKAAKAAEAAAEAKTTAEALAAEAAEAKTKAEALAAALQEAFSGWERRNVKPDAAGNRPSESDFTSFLLKFSQYREPLDSNGKTNDKAGKEVYYFDATPKDITPTNPYRCVTARVECHAEFLSLTIFVPISIIESTITDNQPVTAVETAKEGIWTITHSGKDKHSSDLFRYLYDDFPSIVFPANGGTGASSGDSVLGKVLDLVREEQSDLFETKGVFAHFQGLVVPHTAFLDVPAPHFANPWAVGEFQPGRAVVKTNRFLHSLQDCLRGSVFKFGTQDVVASYMRDGSALYLSGLGSQQSPDSHDPLRFMILYDPLSHFADDSPYRADQKWWLSRFVGRLLQMGTTRLHALHRHKEIDAAARKISQIEKKMEKIEQDHRGAKNKNSPLSKEYFALSDQMHALRGVLNLSGHGAHSRSDDSLIHRATANEVAFQDMMRQLDELSVSPIPGWQSYEALITRRLVRTHQRMAEVVPRYRHMWGVLRTRMEALEARAAIRLNQLALTFAAITAPSVFLGPAPTNNLLAWGLDALRRFGAQGVHRPTDDSTPMPALCNEFDLLAYMLAYALGAGAVWLLIERVWNRFDAGSKSHSDEAAN